MQALRLALPLAAAAVALGLLAPAARADRVTLRNGREIKDCWVLEENKAQVVVAVIREGTVGRIVLDPVEVMAVDRTHTESLEVALARARAAIEADARKRELDRASTPTPTGAPGAAKPGEDASESVARAREARFAALVPPPSPEEEERIASAVQAMGDTRQRGGAGLRREKALKDLVAFGPKAIPAISQALEDNENSYRRMNAARAIADIATQDRRLPLYEGAVPGLLRLLSDPQPWVRVAADRALQAVANQGVGYPEPQGEEPSAEEVAAAERWTRWWDEARKVIQTW